MNEVLDQLRLTIGPLHYEFLAHDAWGVDALGRLRTYVVVVDFTGPADRVVHLADLRMTQEENDQINRDCLPNRYAALLPDHSTTGGWQPIGDQTGHISLRHCLSQHSLFIFVASPNPCACLFQLPWSLLLDDIVARGGAILHGGLVSQWGTCVIVTAPPGGGKTTSIGRLPADWRVLADDACLVWPDADGEWLVCPMPTWSVLLGRSDVLPAIGRWQIATTLPLDGIFILNKSDQDRLSPSPPQIALLSIHQALSEHPQVIANRVRHRTHLFDVACGLAKAVRTWQLDATLDGRFWEHLSSVTGKSDRQSRRLCGRKAAE